MIEQLFFELIRVAIGTQDSLSYIPISKEWKVLYDMAKKQSLVGVCFAGVQKLQTQRQEPPEMLYLTWMGMAAKIQQRNELVNRQCVELGERLKSEGYSYCILKGQGVASLYHSLHSEPSSLSLLRQSGDIDVWVQNRSIPELVEYVKGLGVGYKATAAHVECELFDGTDVELHAEPAFFRSFWNDRKLKRWFQEVSGSTSSPTGGSRFQEVSGFNVPSVEFNLVYMMVHMYHHVLFEGLGLRQLMDYYFVLRQFQEISNGFRVSDGDLTKTEKTAAASAESHNESLANDCSAEIVSELPSSADQSSAPLSGSADTSAKNIKNILSTIDSLGMMRFAQGIMWIMKEVFALEGRYLICEANEKYGRLILDDVLQGGNFGHHNEKNNGLHGGTAVGRSLNGLKRNMKFFALCPWEILSSPVWSIWHYWWRKRNGII